MKRALCGLAVLLFVAPALAQRPSDPALLVPEAAPELDYMVAPTPVTLPDGMKMGATASVAFDASGHLFVLTRGEKTFFEFGPDGTFVRAFGDKLFTRSHGLRIDRDGNLWATDVGGHVVVKLNREGQTLLTLGTRGEAGEKTFFEFGPDGTFVRAFGDKLFTRSHGLRIDRDGNLWATDVGGHVVVKLNREGQTLLTLGTRGEAGEWNEEAGSRRLNQPNDVAIADNGDIFVVQGHTPGPKGDARVLKFSKDGRFVKSWGGKGTGPGQFQVAHGIDIDAKGQLWVADRENQRIQVFDADGTFIREIKYKGLPCSLDIGREYIYMVNGFAGQVLRLDLNGKVLAALGKPGKGPGEFGEAHMIAVNDREEIFVADSVNAALVKLVKR